MIETIYSAFSLTEEEASEIVVELVKKLKQTRNFANTLESNPYGTGKKRDFYNFFAGIIQGFEVLSKILCFGECDECATIHQCPRGYLRWLIYKVGEVLEKEGEEKAKKFVLDQIRLAKTILTHQPKYIM